MIDTGGNYRTIYDRVEYALSWMDQVITGQDFRNVLTQSLGSSGYSRIRIGLFECQLISFIVTHHHLPRCHKYNDLYLIDLD